MSKLNRCECGGEPMIVRVFDHAKLPDCFVKCPKCGRETNCYASRQNARKAWNAGKVFIYE